METAEDVSNRVAWEMLEMARIVTQAVRRLPGSGEGGGGDQGALCPAGQGEVSHEGEVKQAEDADLHQGQEEGAPAGGFKVYRRDPLRAGMVQAASEGL